MTPTEKCKAAAAIFNAAADGAVCECLDNHNGWRECDPFKSSIYVISNPEFWRIKPKPVTRPWSKPEHVPADCWMRKRGIEEAARVVNVTDKGFTVLGFFGWAANYKTFHFGNISDEWEYSTTRAKDSWKPCRVEVEG